jgi:hypothetical protein
MAQLVLNTVFCRNGCGITTANDYDLAILRGLDCGIESSFRALSERIKLKDACGTVSQNGLCFINRVHVKLNALVSTI